MRGRLQNDLLVPTIAIAIAIATAAPASLFAQTTPPPPPESVNYTLHVYANLMQFATIVLGPNLKPLPPIPREKFFITLDGGPPFQPTSMRMQSDDPLSLAILLDNSGPQGDIIRSFADSLAELNPQFLEPHDHITLYALDCRLIRSTLNAPVDGTDLKLAVAAALTHPLLHGVKAKPACNRDLHLWDAVARVTEDLSHQQGRRVLLVVSTGNESGSKAHLIDALHFATANGVAIFGLRNNEDYKATHPIDPGTPGPTTARGPVTRQATDPVIPEDLFDSLCESSGGMILEASQRHLTKNLQDFIQLLRARYILEYPRPDDAKPVIHLLQVTIKGTAAYIRPSGDSAPLPDPAILNDPTTVRSKPSPAKVGAHPQQSPTS